ncbi:MAG: molybdenum cofactor biosynthesis protein B [Pseudomonadota bacterium]
MSSQSKEFIPMQVAVLTVSDTRDEQTDTSGQYLCEQVQALGHVLHAKQIVIDDVYLLREIVSKWIADPQIDCILSTGGTGFTGRDSTPEALQPLLDKNVIGFGELFRSLSLEDVGSSTVQSRAFAGIANQTLLFCMPGSTGACRTAWEGILHEQLDSRHKPCNFVPHTRASARFKGI